MRGFTRLNKPSLLYYADDGVSWSGALRRFKRLVRGCRVGLYLLVSVSDSKGDSFGREKFFVPSAWNGWTELSFI